MAELFKALLALQPSVWLILFGMVLVLLGVIGNIHHEKLKITLSKHNQAAAVIVGLISTTAGTWMFRGIYAPSHPNRDLTPPALRALKAGLNGTAGTETRRYDDLPQHKAMAVSDGGWVGEAANQPSKEAARFKAWAYCIYRAQVSDPCYVVLVEGDQKYGKWDR